MRSILRAAGVLACAAAVVAVPAQGQRRARRAAAWAGSPYRPTFGVHVGYNTDLSDLLVGGQATIPVARAVALYPQFDWYFPAAGTLWALNVDLKFHARQGLGPLYAGAGYDYQHASAGGAGAGRSHLGLFAGVEGMRRWARPYLEARVLLGHDSQFQAALGISW